MKLLVGSLASGIGGDAVAWHPLGWESVFFSEIGKFPSAVLAERFPNVPNLGDFTAVDFCDRARACGQIDVLAGGTPCQAFSVAGKRRSLDDDRGNLTLRFVEVVHALDPRIVVWENVPGVLSTKDNAFGCFIAAMVGEPGPLASGLERGRWPNAGMVIGPVRTLAWRVLDAQYFGLAQRRRRVCLVSFRARDGLNPGAVLFEPESLRRHSPPSREAGAGVAGTLAAGAHPSGFNGQDAERGMLVENPLRAQANASHREDSDTYIAAALTAHHGRNSGEDNYVTHSLRAEGFDASEDGTGRGTPLVPCKAFDWQSGGDARGLRLQDRPQLQKEQVPAVLYQCHGSNVGPMGALRSGNGNETGGVPFVAFDTTQVTSPENRCNPKLGDPCHPLASGAHAPALAHAISVGANQTSGFIGEAVADPDMRVRRLTPHECERLQGFPDGWTRIPWRGNPADKCPDGPRYKGLGNAWATPVFRWIGRRIELVLAAKDSGTSR